MSESTITIPRRIAVNGGVAIAAVFIAVDTLRHGAVDPGTVIFGVPMVLAMVANQIMSLAEVRRLDDRNATAMAALLVSTIPTYSGKLMGERIAREFVLPIFVGAAAMVALLVTYPYGTLTLVTVLYLAAIPISYRRFQQKLQESAPKPETADDAPMAPGPDVAEMPAGETKH